MRILIIIVCLDDCNGMMFHQRRQSQDRVLREYIKKMTGTSKVYMNTYSAKLYQEFPDAVICDDFLTRAQSGEYCLVEDQKIAGVEKCIEKIIVFRWNKIYPSDMKLDVDLKKWLLLEQKELEGSSHIILQQVYIKGEQDNEN